MNLIRQNLLIMLFSYLTGAACILTLMLSVEWGFMLGIIANALALILLFNNTRHGWKMHKNMTALEEIKRLALEGRIDKLEALKRLEELKKEMEIE